jgi:hydrogenase-4 component E
MPEGATVVFGRLVSLLAAAMLVLQFLLAAQRLLPVAVRLFALQSLVLAALAGLVAYGEDEREIYVSVALTLALKVVALPVFLSRVIGRARRTPDPAALVNPPSVLLACGVLTLLATALAQRVSGPSLVAPSVLTVALSLLLIGFFLMIVQRNAVAQVLGLLTAENGLFLVAVALTSGMPLLVELGVFLDVFVAVLVLGLLVTRLRAVVASIDVSLLRRLRG